MENCTIYFFCAVCIGKNVDTVFCVEDYFFYKPIECCCMVFVDMILRFRIDTGISVYESNYRFNATDSYIIIN